MQFRHLQNGPSFQMDKTALELQLSKRPESPDVELYMSVIREHQPNVWIFPLQFESSDSFAIFDHLAQWNLVQRKTVPSWTHGALRGQSVAFLYNEDLDYKGGSEPF